MDYDFITTCNWTQTGTFTLRAYRGSNTDVAGSYTLYYRKKGTPTWSSTSNGQINISSTGEWEVANDWNKSGDDVLTHSYYNITAIDSCTNVYFNEAALGTTVGNYFLYQCWRGCSSLASMPSGFNIPGGITSVGGSFFGNCWHDCSNLKQDDYTEDLVFEFNSANAFGGTCPVRPQSITGASKENPVRVAVNRPEPPPPIGPFIGEKYPLPPFRIG